MRCPFRVLKEGATYFDTKKPNTDFEPNSGEKKEDAGYTLHLGMGPMTKADSL